MYGCMCVHTGATQYGHRIHLILDPLMYFLYVADLIEIISALGTQVHQYAEEVHLYFTYWFVCLIANNLNESADYLDVLRSDESQPGKERIHISGLETDMSKDCLVNICIEQMPNYVFTDVRTQVFITVTTFALLTVTECLLCVVCHPHLHPVLTSFTAKLSVTQLSLRPCPKTSYCW